MARSILDLADPLAQALLLSHFGFFLLWQPVWRGEQKLIPGQVLLIVGAAVLLIVATSWWLMALWLSVLFCADRRQRSGDQERRPAHRLAARGDLPARDPAGLGSAAPVRATRSFRDASAGVVRYGLMIPAARNVLRDAPSGRRPPPAYSVDLFYSLLLFLMVVVLVLGAFVIRQISHGNYVIALAQALLVIARHAGRVVAGCGIRARASPASASC